MCFGGPSIPPPPKLPDPVDTPPAPEKTAAAPVIGRKRKEVTSSASGRSAANRRVKSKTRGTASLRIPLNTGSNLRY